MTWPIINVGALILLLGTWWLLPRVKPLKPLPRSWNWLMLTGVTLQLVVIGMSLYSTFA